MAEDKKERYKLSAKQKLKLKHVVKELEQYKGRHTELVSVYIPSGYDIVKIINHLQQEQGTATNIKSASTRNNVISALERMVQHLRLFKQTPPNGLAVFSGNVAEREGQQDYKVWSIEPPVPLNIRIYRCDKEFVLEPLKDMVELEDVYGLVVMDRRDATLAILKGKTIIPLQTTHSEVPGKIRAGGQSAPRFARLREGAIKDHYKKVADHMKEQFLFMKDLKGILLGGPSTTTNDFLNKGYLTTDVRNKIIAVKDLSYTGDFGLQELLERSQDVLAEEEVAKEKSLMQKFFNLLATKAEMVSYGEKHVKECVMMGAVDILLLSETVDEKLMDELDAEAKKYGSSIEVISIETREGVQLKEMGGIAAILRYPVHV
ncbi:MAG TPA: peptide chain release factor aRF-1 [Candidatus Nanoarchaeia archaeon]|nr:peptide chain release factor aRF-1 [Candidatus Nanoarchaeia archaeon]